MLLMLRAAPFAQDVQLAGLLISQTPHNLAKHGKHILFPELTGAIL
jgi:hypothetical protein